MKIYTINIKDVKKMNTAELEALMPERMKKSSTYRFEEDRLRSIGAGYLIMKYLDPDDESLIEKNQYGKLFVKGYPDFNISHSGDYAVFAKAEEGVIGIDIEQVKQRNLKVANKVFSDREREWMSEDELNRFHILWTLKESVMKALGKGLSLTFTSFEVLDFNNDIPVKVEDKELYLYSREFEGYYIALAVSRPLHSISIMSEARQ